MQSREVQTVIAALVDQDLTYIVIGERRKMSMRTGTRPYQIQPPIRYNRTSSQPIARLGYQLWTISKVSNAVLEDTNITTYDGPC